MCDLLLKFEDKIQRSDILKRLLKLIACCRLVLTKNIGMHCFFHIRWILSFTSSAYIYHVYYFAAIDLYYKL